MKTHAHKSKVSRASVLSAALKNRPIKSNVIRARVLALALKNDEVQRFALAGGSQSATADDKLSDLFAIGGLLGSYLHHPDWMRNHLRRIYGFTTGWLMLLGVKAPIIVIDAERNRQEELLCQGKFLFTCASQVASANRKFRVLAEEIGEVAEAIDKLEMAEAELSSEIRQHQQHLITELFQVAAVAVAWLESLEAK